MAVRCKFVCNSVTDYGSSRSVELSAVYGVDGSDNSSWSKATPVGKLTMSITNEAAFTQFTLGKSYFIDINEVE